MNKDSLLENLSIYNDNLSVYYLSSVFITILSVILAWWYHRSIIYNEQSSLNSPNGKSDVDIKEPLFQELDGDCADENNDNNEEVISKIKLGRHSLLAEEVAATLTQEQLKEEKEVEKQQLEAILQLLKNQEDKFQVSSIQDLQDQLKLYRP